MKILINILLFLLSAAIFIIGLFGAFICIGFLAETNNALYGLGIAASVYVAYLGMMFVYHIQTKRGTK